MTSTITAEDRRCIAWIDELRQKNINADAEIKSLKETLSYAAEMGLRPSSLIDEVKSLKLQLDEEKLAAEHRQAIFGGWGEELTQFRQKNINADAEIKTLKLSLADRDEEVKTLKDDADRWEANCLYAEEWEDKYANGVLGRKKKNEIYADSGGDDDYRQAILDEIKSLKLSLADRDEEVKRLCSQAIERRQEKKELRDEIRSLKFQLADNNGETLSTHEHHRELRDKLHAEIKSLKLQLVGPILMATRYVEQ